MGARAEPAWPVKLALKKGQRQCAETDWGVKMKQPPGLFRAAGGIDGPGSDPTVSGVAGYFFLEAFVLRFSSMAAWAAARRATGTRNGEQLT